MPVLSQKEAAKLWGLNPATVCRWAKPGGPLAKALVGKKLDTDHPCVAAFISGRAASKPSAKAHKFPTQVVADASKRAAGRGPSSELTSEDNFAFFAELGDLTIRQIAEKFPGNSQLNEYLKAWDLYEGARKKQLSNDSQRGELVARHLVETFVFGFIEESHRKLLNDATKTIVRRAYGAANSGQPIEEAERMAKDTITSILRPVKQKIAQRLKEANDAVSVVDIQENSGETA
jgi:hypothetical protein